MIRFDLDKVTLQIKKTAEAHILPYFRNLQPGHISYKIGDDPVTIADQEAESDLSKRLLDLLPGSKVVGEEAFAADNGILSRFFDESPVWIIDPIDGTRNFAKGSPEFGVIVSLVKQNQIIAGWIYDPTSREVLTAERGAGAYFKGQRLKTLPPVPLASMQAVLSPRIIQPFEESAFHSQPAPTYEEMRAGAHEYPRLVIEGPHFGKTQPSPIHFRANLIQTFPWDDAAGVLIHQEAGGYAARWSGEPYSINVIDKGLLLAPDRDSWQAIKNWCGSFCDLPTG